MGHHSPALGSTAPQAAFMGCSPPPQLSAKAGDSGQDWGGSRHFSPAGQMRVSQGNGAPWQLPPPSPGVPHGLGIRTPCWGGQRPHGTSRACPLHTRCPTDTAAPCKMGTCVVSGSHQRMATVMLKCHNSQRPLVSSYPLACHHPATPSLTSPSSADHRQSGSRSTDVRCFRGHLWVCKPSCSPWGN